MIFIGKKIGVLVLKLKASTANMVIFRFLRCPSHKYESFHSKRIIPLGDRGLFPILVCSIWCCDMLETLRPPLAEFHCTPHQICCSIWYCDIDGTFLQPRKTDSIQISPSWEWNICLTVVCNKHSGYDIHNWSNWQVQWNSQRVYIDSFSCLTEIHSLIIRSI